MTEPAKTAADKVGSLADAAALVSDGDVVALGGALSHREPMALVRQLVRDGRRRLHLVGSAHGIDVDLLVGAEVAGTIEESYVGYEQDLGLAPAYRRAAEAGAVAIRESCCYTVLQQLRAAEYGLPFMPVRGIVGSDVGELHPEFATVTCPFTGQELVAVPPLAPDVALIHGLLADRRGNVHIPRPLVLDEHFAAASKRVVVSVERVAPAEEVREAGVTIPYFAVDAVVEAPFGAHPTSCYPEYTYDRRHLAEWVAAAGSEEGVAEYLGRFVAADEDGYDRAVGEERRRELREWRDSGERWMELMA